MKWFGIPVGEISAVVNGRRIRVGTVYEWADTSSIEVFDIPASAFDAETLQRQRREGGAESIFETSSTS